MRKLDMRDDAGYQHDVDRPVAHGLIGDIDLAAKGVARLGQKKIINKPTPAAKNNDTSLNLRKLAKAAAYRKSNGQTPKKVVFWLVQAKPSNVSSGHGNSETPLPVCPEERASPTKPAMSASWRK